MFCWKLTNDRVSGVFQFWSLHKGHLPSRGFIRAAQKDAQDNPGKPLLNLPSEQRTRSLLTQNRRLVLQFSFLPTSLYLNCWDKSQVMKRSVARIITLRFQMQRPERGGDFCRSIAAGSAAAVQEENCRRLTFDLMANSWLPVLLPYSCTHCCFPLTASAAAHTAAHAASLLLHTLLAARRWRNHGGGKIWRVCTLAQCALHTDSTLQLQYRDHTGHRSSWKLESIEECGRFVLDWLETTTRSARSAKNAH